MFSADQRRAALRRFMDGQKIKLAPWCRASGLAESGVRDFLSGRNQTLTDATYEKLAAGANDLLQAD